jgi:acyl-coenzyme A thioesterase PaaI-like protein
LIELTITNAAPPDVLTDITAQLVRSANELASHLPDVQLQRVLLPSDDAGRELPIGHLSLESAMPYDIVIGSCNPLALPVRLEFDPPKAFGVATFSTAYQGAPGCVHGAALAATFDIILTAANALTGAPGLTVRLNLRYRRPTLIEVETRFEGWVTGQNSKRIHSVGRLIQGGEVTMEAEGEFAPIPRSEVRDLAARRRQNVDSHDEIHRDGGP